jgi:hypothetical protein
MQVSVPDPYASGGDDAVIEPDENSEEAVPAASMMATLAVALLGAAVVSRRKDQ